MTRNVKIQGSVLEGKEHPGNLFEPAQNITVWIYFVLSWRWMPEVLKRFREAYPRVEISVGNSHSFVTELSDGKWDIVITPVPVDHPALHFSSLFNDDLVLVMHPDHPLATRGKVVSSDFDGERLISFAPQDQDILYNWMLVPAGVKLDNFMTVEQPEAILSLIIHDFGISVLPKWSIWQEEKSGVVAAVPIGESGTQASWNAVRLDAESYPSYYDEFIRLSCKALRWITKS